MEFFKAVERRLAREFPGKWPSFQVEVCGKLLELQFASEQDAEAAKKGLRRCISRSFGEPDAVFRYWKDDCVSYVGRENMISRWQVWRDDGCIFATPGVGFIGADLKTGAFYDCHHLISQSRPMTYAHVFIQLFYLWARINGLYSMGR